MIPKSFKVFAHTIKVKKVKTLKDEEGNQLLGQADINKNVIKLLDNEKELEVDNSQKEQVFFHEFAHIMFDSIGRNDLSNDESLVDLVGNIIHQYLKTVKY
jgi:hypothetical protein